jgi:hypothetical protein
MKKILFAALILSSTSFTGCKKDIAGSNIVSAANESSFKRKPGTVTGAVTDSRGNPLSNVNITVEHTVWYGTYLFGKTNANGKYIINIPSSPAGSWTAKAKYTKKKYGVNYIFDLDGNINSFTQADSAVRNFKWKLSGKKPGDNGYYGAHVDLYQWGTDADMTKIKIKFTPLDSTLIDGSPAKYFERTVEDVAGTFMVKDVPIGKYSIKAVYPGKKLYLENRHGNGGPSLKKTVIFNKYGFLAETEYNIEFWVSE